MKILYKHLISFLKENPSVDEISQRLFQLGHENEINENIFDIEFTPNRGDCLSVYGLAKDLGIFFGINNTSEIFEGEIEPLNIDFINKSIEDCPKISFLNIEIEKEVTSYKSYLESYFSELDIKKNNFFTDISNYLAYEIGQPIHCYDNAKIKEPIVFKKKEINKKFNTLHDTEIVLSGENCVFLSNNEVINLAGVMGGSSTACDQKTTNSLVECAYFKPESIINKAVKYNLNSDASYKFERGVDPEIHEYALRRFIKIVSDHAKITNLQFYTKNYKNFKNKYVNFDTSKINNVLGTNISEEQYLNYIKKIGLLKEGDKISIPLRRHDLDNQNDLAEEIARIIGYDNIKKNEFQIDAQKEVSSISKEEKLKEFLIDNGFNEVINSPFSDSNHNKYKSISIDNPLDSNKKYLRVNLENSLIDNLIFNENRQRDSIKLFEISNLYIKNDDLSSRKVLGLIVSGRVGENHVDFSKKLNIKYLQELFKKVDIDLNTNQIKEISRRTLKSKNNEKIYYLEIDINNVDNKILNYKKIKLDSKNIFIKYKKVSDFPSSKRDISLLLKNEVAIPKLEELLLNYNCAFLKKTYIFDYYKIDENNIKIGFRFVFQSTFSTLTVDEVDKEMKKIINDAISIDGVSLPGL